MEAGGSPSFQAHCLVDLLGAVRGFPPVGVQGGASGGEGVGAVVGGPAVAVDGARRVFALGEVVLHPPPREAACEAPVAQIEG